jgi:NADH dehydrogenase [ubiquinone] 1 alpha subcomplex assembly factor 6
VDARIKDAEHVGPPPGIPFLEAYANSTASSLLLLLMDTCGVRDSDADHAAAHLGKAIGIANLLRGTHAHSAQRRCYLPADVQARHGASTEDVYRARPTEEVRNAVHEVASVAKAHLDSARAMEPRLGKAGADGGKTAKTVLLPAVGVGKYLEALEAKDFDVFHPELVRGVNPIVTQGRIAWAAFRGTY